MVPIPLAYFLSPGIPVTILSIDTQGEYRYPRGGTDTPRGGTDTLCFKCATASFFLQEYRYPKYEYRYPLHQKGSNG
ncbi:hypothetical protein GQ457_15G016870 [Hibiscus cannabinus]